MRAIMRILAVVLLLVIAFVTMGQYAPDGSFIADASDDFLRAIRASWMIDPIGG